VAECVRDLIETLKEAAVNLGHIPPTLQIPTLWDGGDGY
jgi:hypothetical protein